MTQLCVIVTLQLALFQCSVFTALLFAVLRLAFAVLRGNSRCLRSAYTPCTWQSLARAAHREANLKVSLPFTTMV